MCAKVLSHPTSVISCQQHIGDQNLDRGYANRRPPGRLAVASAPGITSSLSLRCTVQPLPFSLVWPTETGNRAKGMKAIMTALNFPFVSLALSRRIPKGCRVFWASLQHFCYCCANPRDLAVGG